MSHVRPSGRRLAAAVTVVLAVTAGLTGTTDPAQATPSAPDSAAAPRGATKSVVPFPADQELISVTASGYLVRDRAMRNRSWVRASDGAVTKLGQLPVRATGYEDLVAVIGDRTVEVRDLATGRTVLSVPTAPADSVDYAGSARHAVFTTDRDREATAGTELRMHTTDGATVLVTGLPDDARNHFVMTSTSTNALVRYTSGSSERRLGLLDLASGAVTEPDLSDGTDVAGDIALSPTHVAWVERDGAKTSVVVRAHDTAETQRIPVGNNLSQNMEIGLQGDYLTYARKGGLTAGAPDPLHALTAYSLKDGATTKLLDHVVSADISPSGVLYVRGGTVAEGEGIYRVAPGPDGAAPTATLVAATGEPTELTLGRYNILPVIDPSYGTDASMVWNLSRGNAEMKVTLRHERSGKTAEFTQRHQTSSRFSIAWSGDLDRGSLSAYNGDYTWEISARPLNAIGPVLTRTGTFKVVRSRAAPHDFNDNGSPDLLARDSSGHLWREDSHHTREGGLSHTGSTALVGGGWNVYDRIEAAANLGGASTGDLAARDKSGVLWLYLGKGDGTFADRSRIGGGWNVYDKIAAGSDLTNDGKADLLATDKSGVLWLYKGTGNWRAPFESRTRVGGGWGIYNQLTAIGGSTSGDLVARDKTGVLWLYRGMGDGTFATRTRIGGGWGAYQETVGIGDANQDGQTDLFAYDGDGTRYFYAGTGDWHAPFAAREISTLFPAGNNVTSVS
ncbi:FG-GAP repeat domain-containing protein [Streptomyces sp. NPDC056405]|uniref:FG-GAP repeat domain-containing protein n=1 Tax=Streptomyces sp. NPDC056405 TaxID=3345811 RepID=UPI0035D9AACE